MLDVALKLAAAGHRIFPADPETRKPLVKWGEEATTDAATIRGWWEARPNAMPSIALGPRDLVVDVDPRNGGDATFEAMIAAHPELKAIFEAAPAVFTARGGAHFYFKLPEGVADNGVKNGEWTRFGKGIDVKVGGGFVVAPGAVRADGLTYSVLRDGTPGPAPAIIVTDRARDARPANFKDVPIIHAAGTDLEESMTPALVALLAPRLATKGSRHDVARALGGALAVSGWTDEGIAALVGALPSDAPGARISDALAAAERARGGELVPQWGALGRAGYEPALVASVRTMATGGRLAALEAIAAASWAEQAQPPPAAVVAARSEGGWGGHRIEDIRAPIPPINYVCEGLNIAPGPPNLIAGYGGVGKSMITQALVVSVVTGKPLLGSMPVRRGKALHLDWEQGTQETDTRYQRLTASLFPGDKDAGGVLRDGLEIVSPPPVQLNMQGIFEVMASKCDGFDLCVVDSLRACCPGIDENSSDMRQPLDMLLRVSEKTGCAFLVIHHARKDNKNNSAGGNQNMRGNSAINDAARTVIMCEARTKGFNIVSGKIRSGRKFDPIAVVVEDDPTTRERYLFDGLKFKIIDAVAEDEAEERATDGLITATLVRILSEAGGAVRGGRAGLVALAKTPEKRTRAIYDRLIAEGRILEDNTNAGKIVRLKP
jgi:hypothetical protein